MNRLLFCFSTFCWIIISTYAQEKDTETSHYLFPEFTKGVILMNDGMKYETLLNYNSVTEEMIFEEDGKKLAIAKTELGLIDTVFIKERKFIVQKDVLVELLHQSDWGLYAEYKCKFKDQGKPIGYGQRSKTASISSYSSIRGDMRLYELKLPDVYEIEPHTEYWLKKNEELYGFSSLRGLKKLYKEKRDIFKAFVKKHNVEYNNQESIILLVDYLESQSLNEP